MTTTAKEEYGVLWPSFMPTLKREIKAEMERMAAGEARKARACEKVDLPTRSGAPASGKPPGDDRKAKVNAMEGGHS